MGREICRENDEQAAQPAHAADRFAREIVGFLTCFLWRARGG